MTSLRKVGKVVSLTVLTVGLGLSVLSVAFITILRFAGSRPGPLWMLDWQVVDLQGKPLPEVNVFVDVLETSGVREFSPPSRHDIVRKTDADGRFSFNERAYMFHLRLEKEGYLSKKFTVASFLTTPESANHMTVCMLPHVALPLPDELDLKGAMEVPTGREFGDPLPKARPGHSVGFDLSACKEVSADDLNADIVVQLREQDFGVSFMKENTGTKCPHLEKFLDNWRDCAVVAPESGYLKGLYCPFTKPSEREATVLFVKLPGSFARVEITCFWGGEPSGYCLTVNYRLSKDRFFRDAR